MSTQQGSNFRTPLKRAIGLGSAHAGTRHFFVQRVTAIALVLCGVYLLGLLFGLTGADYMVARATVADPINAIVLVGFVVAACWHAKLGLQVVIEDYVHEKPVRTGMLIANVVLCAAFAFTGIFAVAKIAFV